jgi:hypothetical protein
MARYIVKYRKFDGSVKELKGKGKQPAVFENAHIVNNYIRNHKFEYADMWREPVAPSPSLVHNVEKKPHVAYTEPLEEDEGDLFTVNEFLISVNDGCLIDYDGYGYAVKDGKKSKYVVLPSESDLIPKDATHVVWYNN